MNATFGILLSVILLNSLAYVSFIILDLLSQAGENDFSDQRALVNNLSGLRRRSSRFKPFHKHSLSQKAHSVKRFLQSISVSYKDALKIQNQEEAEKKKQMNQLHDLLGARMTITEVSNQNHPDLTSRPKVSESHPETPVHNDSRLIFALTELESMLQTNMEKMQQIGARQNGSLFGIAQPFRMFCALYMIFFGYSAAVFYLLGISNGRTLPHSSLISLYLLRSAVCVGQKDYHKNEHYALWLAIVVR